MLENNLLILTQSHSIEDVHITLVKLIYIYLNWKIFKYIHKKNIYSVKAKKNL